MPKPELSNYPHLHNLLKRDPKANKEFQDALKDARGLASPPSDGEDAALETARRQVSELVRELQDKGKSQAKIIRFIRLLGEVMEPQLKLRRYSEDVLEHNTYNITFSANQIRLALRLYWNVVGDEMERSLAAVAVQASDPDEEEDDGT